MRPDALEADPSDRQGEAVSRRRRKARRGGDGCRRGDKVSMRSLSACSSGSGGGVWSAVWLAGVFFFGGFFFARRSLEVWLAASQAPSWRSIYWAVRPEPGTVRLSPGTGASRPGSSAPLLPVLAATLRALGAKLYVIIGDAAGRRSQLFRTLRSGLSARSRARPTCTQGW